MKKAFLSILFVPLFLGSCISVRYTAFEVKEPAYVTFPADVVNLVIVDNVSVPSYEGEADETKDIITYDSMKINFVENLHAQLTEADFFGNVQIYPYELRADTAYWEEVPLSAHQIASICEEMDGDALVSVDNFFISLSSFPNILLPESIGGVSMNVIAKLRVYHNDGTSFGLPVYFNDTLYWESIDEYGNYRTLPSIREMVNEGIMVTATTLTKQFTPYWSFQTRVYFGENGTEALLTQNKWEEAKTIWENTFETEKKEAKRSRLAFNMALYYEYNDNLDKANEWIQTAIDLLPDSQNATIRNHFTNYKEILTERILSREKLKLQIGQ